MPPRHRHAPRRNRAAEAHQATVQAVMEKLGRTEQDTPARTESVSGVEYPEDITTTAQEVYYNAATIGGLYDTLLPERGLGQAFGITLTEVADVLEQRSQRPQGELYFNALSELKLVSEVERLFIEGDFAHVEVLPFVDKDGRSSVVQAGLEGIKASMKATGTFPEGKKRGEEYEVEATFATWRFDPTGIRLAIEYQDPVTGTLRTVQARMDFHYRKNPKFGDKKQAALDLDGGYLKKAITSSSELDRDYHRHEHLNPLINSAEEFARIRELRLQHAKSVVAASNKAHEAAKRA